MDPRDRVRGVLLGLAAGDRIGGPLQMALCLAESLIGQQQFNREDILRRYLAWWRAEGFDTGPVSASVFQGIASGLTPEVAVARTHAAYEGRTAGCNPAHRAPPLAMTSFLMVDQLPGLAIQEASLTHQDPLAGEVASAAVVLCRYLILGSDWDVALQQAAQGRDAETQNALLGGIERPFNAGGFAPDVLQAAVAFISTHEKFAPALKAALAFAGPANYCPVLAGAIAGARWGASAIPSEMLAHCP